jgi:hypothetical protein
MRMVGYIATALAAGVVIGVIVVGASSTGDVRRYVRMRKM